MDPVVSSVISKQKRWRAEFEALRTIMLASGLDEALKWGQPCYSVEGTNVALMHGFKDYCAVLFHQGALLKDPKGLLVQQTPNVQAARQVRFTSVKDVEKHAKALAAWLKEATANARAGKKVELKKTEAFERPEEFEVELQADAALREAFAALTPGRQRG